MPPRTRSHKQTIVWQWLHSEPAPSSEYGTVVRALRGRMDMPHRFPNRRYLYDYMTARAKIDPAAAERVVDLMWSSYYAFNQKVTSASSAITSPSAGSNSDGEPKRADFQVLSRLMNGTPQ